LRPVASGPVFFWWWYRFDAYAPSIFLEGGAIASSGGFAAIAISIGMSVWRGREAKAVTTYGSARWATRNRGNATRSMVGANYESFRRGFRGLSLPLVAEAQQGNQDECKCREGRGYQDQRGKRV
jgi:type IV secretory pathway TraG/TraD family ATPase VirD4